MSNELVPLGAALAAFIAAAFSLVKLLAEKENEISQFRKEWVSTFRNSIADVAAEAALIVGRVSIRIKHKETRGFTPEESSSLEVELTDHWLAFRKAYFLALTHLNIGETSFGLDETYEVSSAKIESHLKQLHSQRHAVQLYLESRGRGPMLFEPGSGAAIELVARLRAVSKLVAKPYLELAQDITQRELESLTKDIVFLSNIVIKTEWVRIKQGEPSYRRTVVAGLLMSVSFGAAIIWIALH